VFSNVHPLGIIGALGEETVGELARGLTGELVGPDDETYNSARDTWNGLVNRYPALVVQVGDSEDVATVVQFARDHELPLSVRAGAHNQTGSAIAENGVVIDLRNIDHVDVDADRKIANVGPGNSTADALAATQEHGLAFPTGSAGGPGIAGTTLGGGIGWIRRKHGLAVDTLRSVEVVTAAGNRLRASPEENVDLFRAIQTGGGSNFGIVTNFEFDCFEVGPMVGGLSVFYPRSTAAEVFEAFREFVDSAPPEATTLCNYADVPAIPGIPPEHHGEEAMVLIGCYVGDPEAGMETFAPLRSVTEPLVDNSGPVPYEMLHEMGTILHPWGRKYVHRSAFVDDLTDDLHEFVLDRTAAAPGPMDGVGIWPMGGAVVGDGSSPFPWAGKSHMIVVEAAWESHDNLAHIEWARETERALRDRGGEGAYAGYAGVEEQEWENWTEQAYGDALDFLRTVKREYDPEAIFDNGLTISPAGE
jgi:FAD/FMN-containing dehydrogenases